MCCIILAPVEAAINALLDALTQGLEEDSNDEGGDDDSYLRGLLEKPPQEGLQSNDAASIDGYQCAREQAIDQGLVDEHIYIPQSIA